MFERNEAVSISADIENGSGPKPSVCTKSPYVKSTKICFDPLIADFVLLRLVTQPNIASALFDESAARFERTSPPLYLRLSVFLI